MASRLRRLCTRTIVAGLLVASLGVLFGCNRIVQRSSLEEPNGNLSIPIDLLRTEPSEELLSLHIMETVRVEEDGTGTVRGVVSTKSSPLVELYQRYWEAYRTGPELRESLRDQVGQEYLLFLGSAVSTFELQALTRRTDGLSFEYVGALGKIARYDDAVGCFSIFVRRSEGFLKDALLNQFMTELMFRALFMNSRPGRQRFQLYRETRVELPPGAVVLGTDISAGREWYADLGEGTRFWTQIVADHGCVLMREFVVQPETSPQWNVGDGTLVTALTRLAGYGSGEVRYILIGTGSGAPSTCARAGPEGESYTASGEFRWEQQVTFSASVTVQHKKLPRDCSVTLPLSFSLGLNTFIGWRFSSSGGLEWFDAHLEPNASLTLKPEVTISVPLRKPKGDKEPAVWRQEKPFFVWIGFIPVWIKVEASLTPTLELNVAAPLAFRGNCGFSQSVKAGVLFSARRWQPQFQYRGSFTSPTLVVVKGGSGAISVGPALELAAYIYNVAGPYAQVRVAMEGSLSVGPPRKWELAGLLQITAGFRTSDWFLNYIGIGVSLDYELLRSRWPLTSGTW